MASKVDECGADAIIILFLSGKLPTIFQLTSFKRNLPIGPSIFLLLFGWLLVIFILFKMVIAVIKQVISGVFSYIKTTRALLFLLLVWRGLISFCCCNLQPKELHKIHQRGKIKMHTLFQDHCL